MDRPSAAPLESPGKIQYGQPVYYMGKGQLDYAIYVCPISGPDGSSSAAVLLRDPRNLDPNAVMERVANVVAYRASDHLTLQKAQQAQRDEAILRPVFIPDDAVEGKIFHAINEADLTSLRTLFEMRSRHETVPPGMMSFVQTHAVDNNAFSDIVSFLIQRMESNARNILGEALSRKSDQERIDQYALRLITTILGEIRNAEAAINSRLSFLQTYAMERSSQDTIDISVDRAVISSGLAQRQDIVKRLVKPLYEKMLAIATDLGLVIAADNLLKANKK